MTVEQDLTLVVELALLTEDRVPDEQRALLRVSHRLDKDRNKDTVPHRPVSPRSALYLVALETYKPSEGRPVRTLGEKIDRYYR